MSWTKKFAFSLFILISFTLSAGFYLGHQTYPQMEKALNTNLDLVEKNRTLELITFLQPLLDLQLSNIKKTLHTTYLTEAIAQRELPSWILVQFEYIHDQDPILKVNYESHSFRIQKDPLFFDQLQNKVHQKISQLNPEAGKSFEITLDDLHQNSTRTLFLLTGYFYEQNKARILLLDAPSAFYPLKNISPQLNSSRALLTDSDGIILFHSQAAFIGSKVSPDILTELKANEAVYKSYTAIDKTKVHSSLVSLENSSLIFLVETPISQQTYLWLTPENTRVLIQASFILVFIFIFYILLSLALSRKLLKIISNKIQTHSTQKPPSTLKAEPELLLQTAAIKAGPMQVLHQDKVITTEKNPPLEEINNSTLNVSNPENIPLQLCQALQDLTQSPLLYFGFHTENKLLHLEQAIDLELPQSHLNKIPIDEITLNAILKCEKEKKIASLTHYPPLHEFLKTHFKDKKIFEAWALTTPYQQTKNPREPVLIGIIVLFQKGFQDDQHKKSFIKILRSVGIAYETLASKP